MLMVIYVVKKINGLNINFEQYGNKQGKNIVLLHGWGQNIEMMRPLGNPLSKQNYITIIDLPGHGASDIPDKVLSLYDYVQIVKKLLDELGIKKPILMGHSFGGKISLIYASKYDVEKLVLFGSPYKKEITKLSLKVKILKQLKKVPVLNKLENFAKKHMGSTDYRNANPIMRKILVEHVNLDITEEVKKITAPTLIIWGTADEAVPIERAYELEKLIANSGVVEYPGCTHYAYLENLNQTVRVLKCFLGGR